MMQGWFQDGGVTRWKTLCCQSHYLEEMHPVISIIDFKFHVNKKLIVVDLMYIYIPCVCVYIWIGYLYIPYIYGSDIYTHIHIYTCPIYVCMGYIHVSYIYGIYIYRFSYFHHLNLSQMMQKVLNCLKLCFIGKVYN